MGVAGAYVLRNPIITIAGTSYAGQLTKARLVPDIPVLQLRTLDPASVATDVDSATWILELNGVQNWKDGQGVADKLHDLAGTSVQVVLQPRPGTGERVATFNIIAHDVEFGGERGEFATFEAEFPVEDVPVFTNAA